MTPVALWTGRLPGLRPLPRKRTLWAGGLVIALGIAGALGTFGPNGPYLSALASLVAGGIVLSHRWPTGLPLGLKPKEAPQGPDERAVMVEIRQDGDLLGWDVGVLWFEKGGVGFVGRTVSFVLPRASMQAAPAPHVFQTVFRAPQMTAKVFETTVGIVPLGEELRSQMTLARIDALPETSPIEAVLPPTTMHPDLIQRGSTARRRIPFVVSAAVANYFLAIISGQIPGTPGGAPHLIAAICGGFAMILGMALGPPLPKSIRDRLPR